MKTALKVLIWVLVILVVIFLVLFITARVSGLGTIPALVRYLIDEFNGVAGALVRPL